MIEGVWQRYGPLRIQLQGRRNQLQASMQGQRVSLRRELTELLPVVVDAPQGRPLVTGVAADRRRWLDALTMMCESGVQHHHRAYLRALMQRSRLLRQSSRTDELDAWEAQLVRHGQHWRRARSALCQAINQALREEETLVEGTLQLSVNETAPADVHAWQQQLSAGRHEDRRLGRCRLGPHADHLLILWRGHEVRRAGSRGQQRLVALALRLAECQVRQQARGSWPLLLLDDALEALDSRRQLQVLRRLQSFPGQLLLSIPGEFSLAKETHVHCMTVHHRE